MATRGLIARQINNGEVEYLYSHWDNYIECNGITLYTFYNTKEKVDALFAKNKEISSLAENVEETSFYEEDNDGVRKCKLHLINTKADNMWAEYIYVFTLKGEWKYKNIWSLTKEDGELRFGWTGYQSLEKAVEKINQSEKGE